MSNIVDTLETKQDSKIILTFDESELRGMYQSDEYDYTPKDLSVEFDISFINKAKNLFELDPELFGLKYRAEINSDSFEGKLRADLIQIFNVGDLQSIYACFCNDWTGTSYELDITEKVLKWLELHQN